MTLNIANKKNVSLYRAMRRARHYVKQTYHLLSPSSETRPVFILGSGRSGTDIVAHCLGKSWDTELINEDNPKAFDNWRLKGFDEVEQAVNSSGAGLILFKPIVETLRARELLEEFRSGLIVYVIRNPYDAINSMTRFFGDSHIRVVKSWVKTDFERQTTAPDELRRFISDHCHEGLSAEDASGLYWLLYNSAYFFLDLRSDHRATLLQYEKMVQMPRETMEAICRFLSIKWSPSMISEVYGASVGKNQKPNLSPIIEKRCVELWGQLTGENL